MTIDLVIDRRDKLIAGVRHHVCDATLSTVMGRRTPFGSKSAVLYLSERRVSNTDQGMRFESVSVFVDERSSHHAVYKHIDRNMKAFTRQI